MREVEKKKALPKICRLIHECSFLCDTDDQRSKKFSKHLSYFFYFDGAPKKYSNCSSCSSSVLVVRICLLICFFSLRYTFSFVFFFVPIVSFLFLHFLLQLYTHLLQKSVLNLKKNVCFRYTSLNNYMAFRISWLCFFHIINEKNFCMKIFFTRFSCLKDLVVFLFFFVRKCFGWIRNFFIIFSQCP